MLFATRAGKCQRFVRAIIPDGTGGPAMTESSRPRRESVLVTGAGGFLGRHVIAELQRLHYSPVLCPPRHELDLLQPGRVREYLSEYRPKTVIHLAAVVGGIGANRAHPGSFFYENLVMGVHLMEEARKAGVARFVAIATICSY